MKYTRTQAEKLAKQIKSRFGDRISEVTNGTIVPPELLAGLISVEAGKDRNGQIREDATRFEAGVFAKLKAVRAGKLLQYNSIRPSQLKDASDAALRALSTSYGLTQIMNWWAIPLGVSVEELRSNHLKYAIKLLMLNAQRQLLNGEYDKVFRIWNTGRPNGKTHDPDYVANATAVMNAYSRLEEPVIPLAEKPAEPEPAEPAGDTTVNIEHAEEVNAPGAQPVEGGGVNDPPVQASQGGKKSLWATITGGAGAGLTAFAGWSQSNTFLFVVGIICLTALLLALIFRQVIMDYIRLNYLSRPDRINVK